MSDFWESQWLFLDAPKIFFHVFEAQKRTETRIKIHPTSVQNLRAAPATVQAVKLTLDELLKKIAIKTFIFDSYF